MAAANDRVSTNDAKISPTHVGMPVDSWSSSVVAGPISLASIPTVPEQQRVVPVDQENAFYSWNQDVAFKLGFLESLNMTTSHTFPEPPIWNRLL
jgi:hypothetical protein